MLFFKNNNNRGDIFLPTQKKRPTFPSILGRRDRPIKGQTFSTASILLRLVFSFSSCEAKMHSICSLQDLSQGHSQAEVLQMPSVALRREKTFPAAWAKLKLSWWIKSKWELKARLSQSLCPDFVSVLWAAESCLMSQQHQVQPYFSNKTYNQMEGRGIFHSKIRDKGCIKLNLWDIASVLITQPKGNDCYIPSSPESSWTLSSAVKESIDNSLSIHFRSLKRNRPNMVRYKIWNDDIQYQ